MPLPSPCLFLSFAHPDDETFLAGGTACRCADSGVRVVLATATRGESGKVGDPPVCSREALPQVREQELGAAARLLHIASVHLLGYRDRELSAARPDAIREQLVRLIRAERPAVVITFDPNGGNEHPDHIAVSRFTSDAVAAAADPRWYRDAGPAHQVLRLLWVAGRRPWERALDPGLADQGGADFVIDVTRWADRKVAALRAHRTQHGSAERHFFAHANIVRRLGTEMFRQAWGPAMRARPLPDVFDGLDPDAVR